MKQRILFLLSLLAATAVCSSAAAQKSEIRVGYGLMSSNSLLKKESAYIGDMNLTTSGTSTPTSSGALYASYRIRILPMVRLGASFGYEQVKKDYVMTTPESAVRNFSGNNKYLTFAADLQFRYFQLPAGILSLYWGASLGVGIHKQTLTPGPADPDPTPVKGRDTRVAYQVTPLGLTVGVKNFGAFGEVGFGYKGIFQLGVYARF